MSNVDFEVDFKKFDFSLRIWILVVPKPAVKQSINSTCDTSVDCEIPWNSFNRLHLELLLLTVSQIFKTDL